MLTGFYYYYLLCKSKFKVQNLGNIRAISATGRLAEQTF